jgi:uncharacterized protein YjbJ (UPF0337 family)
MNNEMFKGKWNQIKGKIKEKWGKLTDDELARINGKRDQLLGSLEEKYGWERQRAEDELKRFESSLDHSRENMDTRNSRENMDTRNEPKHDRTFDKDRSENKDRNEHKDKGYGEHKDKNEHKDKGDNRDNFPKRKVG